MSKLSQGFYNLIQQQYAPIAVLIDANGMVQEVHPASKAYFPEQPADIEAIFEAPFLRTFSPIFEAAKAQNEILRSPVFCKLFSHEQQFSVTVGPYQQAGAESLYFVVLQPIFGRVQASMPDHTIKPISQNADLKELIDELSAANEEINASNEELVTMNEELNQYKNYLEQMVEKRTAELEGQRTQFKNIIDNLPGAVVRFQVSRDGEGRIIFLSDQTEAIMEVSNEEALQNANAHWNLVLEEDLPGMTESLQKSIAESAFWQYTWRVRTKSGKVKWLEGIGVPERLENGSTEFDILILDITQQKKAEKNLLEQKAMLERTEAIAHVGSWEWDIAKDHVTWSNELFRIFERDPAKGAPSYEEHPNIYTEKSYKQLDALVKHAIEHGSIFEFETEIITGSGDKKYCIARAEPRKGPEGNITHLFGSFQDITDRKRAEMNWKESQADYKAITDSVPGVVLKYELDPVSGADRLLYLNKGVEQLHEIPQEQALENVELVWERIHPDDLEDFKASVVKSAETRSFWQIEYRIALPDGRVKWAEGRGMPQEMPDGKILWNTLLMDITDKVKAKQALQQINDQLDLAIETAHLGVWVFDIETEELEWNDVLLEIYGITREEFNQNLNGWQQQLHPEDSARATEGLSKIFEGERVKGVNFRIIRPDGELRHILASGAPLSQNGAPDKFVGINIDITDIVLNEQELINAKENAEASEQKLREGNQVLKKVNEELDRFVYSVSHDLRAPIASAIGLSKLAENATDIDEILHFNSLKLKTLHKLDQFIQDILDYSRNSRLELKPEPIDFRAIVDLILIEYHQAIQEKGIAVNLHISGEDAFYCDKLRVNIILNNLISNAFKFLSDFRKKPQVEITVKVEKGHATIRVSDNGIGIEPTRKDRIFEMFYRATDRRPGSGIGLYILKECMEKLSGRIEIESEVDVGTTFTLNIPDLKNA